MSANINTNSSFSDVPLGLKLQQTKNAGDTSVTIPSDIKRVYAVCIGGGGSGGSSEADGAAAAAADGGAAAAAALDDAAAGGAAAAAWAC